MNVPPHARQSSNDLAWSSYPSTYPSIVPNSYPYEHQHQMASSQVPSVGQQQQVLPAVAYPAPFAPLMNGARLQLPVPGAGYYPHHPVFATSYYTSGSTHSSPAVGGGYFGPAQYNAQPHAAAHHYAPLYNPYPPPPPYHHAVEYPPHPYSFNPFEYAQPAYFASSGGAEVAAAAAAMSEMQARGRWQAPSSLTSSTSSVWQPTVVAPVVASSESSASLNAAVSSATLVAGVELDHPSYDRPPHRATSQVRASKQVTPPVATSAPVPQQQQQEPQPIILSTKTLEDGTQEIEYDLAPNVATVPPPPAVERSAVPLADFAVELVWEACLLGIEVTNGGGNASRLAQWSRLTNKPASLLNEVAEAHVLLRAGSSFASSSATGHPQVKSITSPNRQRTSHGGPHTPELYGAIGEGRMRKISNDGCASDFSSPSSSAPGTPAGVNAVEAASAKKQRLAGLGLVAYGCVGDAAKGVGMDDEAARRALASDGPVEALRLHARRLSNLSTATTTTTGKSSAPTLPNEPTAAFRQFVKQVLYMTLLTPEDLVLALYYVARIPATSIIAPLPADQAHSLSAKASAVKSAPYKIILAALMVANKTLQDNSYRNETFASVSGIPLKDVNDLEVHLFGALKFDVAVRENTWATWLSILRDRVQTQKTGDIGDRFEVELAIKRLLRSSLNSPSAPSSPALSPNAPMVTSPLARPQTPENSPGALNALDLDASGPLESPLRFVDRTVDYEVSPTPCAMKGVSFPTSNSRSFGVELSFNRF